MNRRLILVAIIVAGGMSLYFKVQTDKYFEIAKNLEIFSNAYKELNKGYVDEVDPAQLMSIGIKAMMASLDPYTNFYSENQFEAQQFRIQGSYDGIGAKVEMIDGKITIVQPYKGYAADEAGLKAGDQIIKIQGRSVAGYSLEEARILMQGVNDSDLDITIARPGVDPFEVSLDRERVNRPNVPYAEKLDGDIAYVNLTTFTANAAKNVNNAIKKVKDENDGKLNGIILDLRDNGGGLLSEAVKLSNLFIPQNKLVVSTRSKIPEEDKSYKTRKPVIYGKDVPLVVLVNDRSASASEIVSGTIQDYDRGVLMGQRTYGKGLVQNFAQLGYNSQMKLTISKYYIPSGRCIQSVAYENGEPKEIADSLRNKFYTENGRLVLDGGGVKPDVKLSQDERGRIARNLKQNHIIFKFVNDYISKVEELDDIKTYTFNDYDAFLNFLKKEKLDLNLKAEKELKDLEKAIKEQPFEPEVQSMIDKARQEIERSKRDDLKKYESYISELIAEEIVARFEYMKGRVIKKLQYDPEVKEAVALIKDEKRYKKILGEE